MPGSAGAGRAGQSSHGARGAARGQGDGGPAALTPSWAAGHAHWLPISVPLSPGRLCVSVPTPSWPPLCLSLRVRQPIRLPRPPIHPQRRAPRGADRRATPGAQLLQRPICSPPRLAARGSSRPRSSRSHDLAQSQRRPQAGGEQTAVQTGGQPGGEGCSLRPPRHPDTHAPPSPQPQGPWVPLRLPPQGPAAPHHASALPRPHCTVTEGVMGRQPDKPFMPRPQRVSPGGVQLWAFQDQWRQQWGGWERPQGPRTAQIA